MGTTNSMPNAKFKIAFINIINKHVSWPKYGVITVFYSVYFMCFTEFDNLNIMKTFFPNIFVPCSYVSESGIRLCIVYSISFTIYVLIITYVIDYSLCECPNGWVRFEGSCYLFGHTEHTFPDAEVGRPEIGHYFVFPSSFTSVYTLVYLVWFTPNLRKADIFPTVKLNLDVL